MNTLTNDNMCKDANGKLMYADRILKDLHDSGIQLTEQMKAAATEFMVSIISF